MSVSIITYGGIMQRVDVPYRRGQMANVLGQHVDHDPQLLWGP